MHPVYFQAMFKVLMLKSKVPNSRRPGYLSEHLSFRMTSHPTRITGGHPNGGLEIYNPELDLLCGGNTVMVHPSGKASEDVAVSTSL